MTKRTEKLVVYNVGYQGRKLPGFLRLMKEFGIAILIDVRESPRSRVAGFHGTTLKRALEAEGIEYRAAGHVLGGRTCSRRQCRQGCKRVYDLAKEYVVCIMCMERDIADCHRGALAVIVEEMGCRSVDL